MTKKCTILLFMLASCIAQGSQAPDAGKPSKEQIEAIRILATDTVKSDIDRIEKEKNELIEQLNEAKTEHDKQLRETQEKHEQERTTWIDATKATNLLKEQAEKRACEWENKYRDENADLQEKQKHIQKLEQEIEELRTLKESLSETLETQKTTNKTAVNTIDTLTTNLADANTNTKSLLTTLQTVNTSLSRWKLGSSILAGVTIVSLLGNFLLGYCHSHKCDKADAAQDASSQTPADDQTSVSPVLPEEEPFTQQNTQGDSYFETDADEQDADEESYPEVISVPADISEDPSDLIAAA